MFEFVKHLFLPVVQLPAGHPDYRKAVFIKFFSGLFIFIVGFFAPYNLLVTKMYALAGVQALVLITLIAINRQIQHSGNIGWAINAFMAIAMLLSMFFIVVGQKQNYSLIWTLAVPIIAFFLMGRRRAILLTSAYLLYLFGYLYIITPETIPLTAAINIIFAISLLAAVVYYYEVSRESVQNALEKMLAKEREQAGLLRKLSTTDGLTQLYNRARLDELFTLELERAKRYKQPFSLIILDIDHFKKINDTYGHQVGDQILKAFAQLLRENTRKTDHIGRWGGEEFMVVASNTTREAALTLADNLRKKIETSSFPMQISCTASLGVATTRRGDDENSMLKRADARLYTAKEQGRNRVVAA